MPKRLIVPLIALAALAGAAFVLFRPGGVIASLGSDSLWLRGVVRDFYGGHPDFRGAETAERGHQAGLLAATLGPDGEPVLAGAGRAGITDARRFGGWFRDELGMNASMPLTLVLEATPNGRFVFDDTTTRRYARRGGFFPVDDELLGNEGADHNHHFTFRVDATFTYDPAAGQFLAYRGNGELWIYVDGRLVIDHGGVHDGREGRVDFDDLALEPARVYDVDVLLAHRVATTPRLRLETNVAFDR
ncbi:MAG: fibro-slime domain-containing protein [Planctomycetota bacterium]|jgi:fibro-slime domain-containing protein